MKELTRRLSFAEQIDKVLTSYRLNVLTTHDNPSPQPSPSRGEGVIVQNCSTWKPASPARGEGDNVSFAKQTVKVFSPFTSHLSLKRAFTLAEVLITLAIIGVVAAITLPAITANIQKVVLKNQLKKFYTNFSNGIKQVKVNLNPEIQCYYWNSNPYGAPVCTATDEYGGCTNWILSNGSELPSDYNGKISDCKNFDNELFGKVFQISKFCKKNALANGCLTKTYNGADKVKAKLSPDVEQNPNQYFSDSNIKNNYPVWILADGTVVIRFERIGTLPLYAVDVNGHKGPNKWGYDIFTFKIIGNEQQGIRGITGVYLVTEKGGTHSHVVFDELFSK